MSSSSNIEELKKQLDNTESSSTFIENTKEKVIEDSKKGDDTEEKNIEEDEKVQLEFTGGYKNETSAKKLKVDDLQIKNTEQVKIKQPREFNKYEIENRKKYLRLADNPQFVKEALKFFDEKFINKNFQPKTYEDDEKKIFIKNIPQEFSEMKIEKIFEKYGSIQEIRMPYDRFNNKSRGFAYITFETVESAEKALKHKTSDFLILRPGEYVQQAKKNSIFVRNLPFIVEEERLQKYFAKFSPVTDIRIPKSSDGRNKGFAFVDFEKNADLSKLLKHKHVFDEHDLFLTRAGENNRNKK